MQTTSHILIEKYLLEVSYGTDIEGNTLPEVMGVTHRQNCIVTRFVICTS